MNRSFRLIMGRHCVAEVLKHSPERIVEVYTSQKGQNDELYDELVKNRVRIIEKSKQQLTSMVASDSHQSYVAAVKERGQCTMREFLEHSSSLDHSIVLMLDSIYDPQNFGAILRAAECFGADLVIYSKNRGTELTPTVSKTSAGAGELVELCKVSNLSDTMLAFQKEGYAAISADVGEGTQNLHRFKFPPKTLLIMGSEGTGIQPLLKKKCDYRITIPMSGKLESLNVSQAAAVILNAYRTSIL